MLRGRIFNLQRYSVQDGPGIRTTVFLKGCPLRCAWCHNPEGISAGRELVLLENRCLVCGTCRAACPQWEPPAGPGPVPTGRPECTLCGGCVEACPAAARELVGRDLAVNELLAEVLADRIFYEESGGGVTFSGGEPFTQPEFLLAMLEAASRAGLHTAVDTCGAVARETLMAAAERVSLFLYDLKLLDDARHRAYTGVSNGPILENLHAVDRAGAEVWVRVPLIPGVTDDPGNLKGIAEFVARLRSVRRVCLLPYHRTGIAKAARIGPAGSGYTGGWPVPTPREIESALECFRGCPVPARVGG